MGEPAPTPWTVEQFLEWERAQEDRWEYAGGLARMMVGGSHDHSTIQGNLFSWLHRGLAGTPCRPFFETKVRSQYSLMYPDVVVTCSPVPPKDDVLPAPVVVVEVLSPSTQALDRGVKAEVYRSIDSLQHLVLVSQDGCEIDMYTRDGDG